MEVSLINGKTFYGKIWEYKSQTLTFQSQIAEINSDKIGINEVKSIKGRVHKSKRKAFQKDNPNLEFISGSISNTEIIATKKASKPETNKYYQPTSGDLMQQAGKRYLIGIVLAGGGLAVMGSSQSNTTLYIGGGATIIGAIISITGHVKLIEAGEALNREAITLSPSESGIGLAINF